MYLRRDHLIKKQIKENSKEDSSISKDILRRVESKAIDQLAMNRIKSR